MTSFSIQNNAVNVLGYFFLVQLISSSDAVVFSWSISGLPRQKNFKPLWPLMQNIWTWWKRTSLIFSFEVCCLPTACGLLYRIPAFFRPGPTSWMLTLAWASLESRHRCNVESWCIWCVWMLWPCLPPSLASQWLVQLCNTTKVPTQICNNAYLSTAAS